MLRFMRAPLFVTAIALVAVSDSRVLPGAAASLHSPNEVECDKSLDRKSDAEKWVSLFDGENLDGWEGDQSVFRIEDGAIVGGQTSERIPHNFFLASRERYKDFDLRLEFRLKGKDTNAGVQIRSERIPDHHEMVGYQADLGGNYWGCLYDESRRRTVLARPATDVITSALKPGQWNRYRIRCEGRRIQLWINDVQTVDYRESDASIVQDGHIALQIHGGPPGEAWYRKIRVKMLTP
jgi:3-keto-disaccharide hydrolase